MGSGELHESGAAIALGKLNQAEPVAIGVETERFGVDGNGAATKMAARQIALIELDVRVLAQA
jgi:hypothetical protein